MALARMSAWEDMGPVKGGHEYNLLFHGWHGWLSRSEPIRARWKGNFDVESRIWEEFPFIDQCSVRFETWGDVVTLTDVSLLRNTPHNS